MTALFDLRHPKGKKTITTLFKGGRSIHDIRTTFFVFFLRCRDSCLDTSMIQFLFFFRGKSRFPKTNTSYRCLNTITVGTGCGVELQCASYLLTRIARYVYPIPRIISHHIDSPRQHEQSFVSRLSRDGAIPWIDCVAENVPKIPAGVE